MRGTRVAPAILLAFGAAGALGAWPLLPAGALAALMLILPGFVVAPLLTTEDAAFAPDQLATALSLSLILLNVGMALLVALQLSLHAASWSLGGVYCVAAVAALVATTTRDRKARTPGRRGEWLAFAIALAVLLPAIAKYAGGGVDDWWDLAYVRALADRSTIDFAEPMLGTGAVHPRFAWNVWLLFQAAVLEITGENPVELQAFALAPLVGALAVAAVAALARSMFGASDRVMVVAAVLVTPVWLYGTESLPYFTRVHQDKFVAGLVLLPMLLSAALDYLSRPTSRRLVAVACHALAVCSVHSLVFGIGALGVALAALVAERAGRERRGWYTIRTAGHPGFGDLLHLAVVCAVVAALPAWQALRLRGWFAGGQVAITMADNPVVRAHLALDRLLAPDSAYMVVSPAAIFGPVALVCVIGLLAAAWRRRRGDGYLLALTIGPAAIIFMPLVAGGVGELSVPWMLYRVGWLIPQPLLMARAIAAVLANDRAIVRLLGGFGLTALLLGLSTPVAADRIRRGMREHPFVHELEPRGTTLEAYRALRETPARSAVLAPPGFSNVVPAMTGRPVVAFSERGTLVFAGDERDAYGRMRDRAEFFSCATGAAERERIANAYGVGHVVFRRRYLTAGDENAWLDRASAEGLLMATDATTPIPCTATRSALMQGLPVGWHIVLANRDYFVVATSDAASGAVPASTHSTATGDWRSVFDLSPAEPPTAGAVVASATGFPGGQVTIDPPPAGFGITDELAWAGGGALWDDGPFEVTIDLGRDVACLVSGLELIPYLEMSRREVLEIRVEGRRWRVRARDGAPIRLPIAPARRAALRIEITSLFGLPFGLADLRLLGDPAACNGSWRGEPRPTVARLPASTAQLIDLVAEYPRGARIVGALARRRHDEGAADDSVVLLRRAVLRDSDQSVPWIEYGLLLDEAGHANEARVAYARARAADSNSAWAEGCVAWAELRAGAVLRALWHSWRAYRLDRRYADALTIRGMALERLGFVAASADTLEHAIALAPRRSWPCIERARQLSASGARDDARALLIRCQASAPVDEDIDEALRAVASTDSESGD